ncbi:Lrp/AsnC family transcriptional regulator [Streptomyces sp. NPDC056638]|uniref:Lrp/AsnC family transcriptional regulator n=1 Tax=Streptomyces sp. NPDC056638 TaxID=3345887 RepID=UPI0036ADB435
MLESPPPRLDEIDALLLDLLQHEAGHTLHDLGEQVGLSPSAVQRRIARYRKDGLITRQVAVLDAHRFGSTVLAAVLVTLDQQSFEHHRAFSKRMRSDSQVQQCYRVAGPWDYVVVLAARSMPIAAGSVTACSRRTTTSGVTRPWSSSTPSRPAWPSRFPHHSPLDRKTGVHKRSRR